MSSLHRPMAQQPQQPSQHQQLSQTEGMVEMILRQSTDNVIAAAHTIGSQWQSAQNDLADRCLIVDRIGQVVGSMESCATSWLLIERLREMVFTLEKNLYVTAPSKEDYMNSSTLEERVHAAASKMMPPPPTLQNQQARRRSPPNDNGSKDSDDYGRFSNAAEDEIEVVEGSANMSSTTGGSSSSSSSSVMLSPGGRGRGMGSSQRSALSPQLQHAGTSPRLAAAATGRDTPSNNSATKGDDASTSSKNNQASLRLEARSDTVESPYLYGSASSLGGRNGLSLASSSPHAAPLRTNTTASHPFLSPGVAKGDFPFSIVSQRPLNERLSEPASSWMQLQSHMANAGLLSSASRFALGSRVDAESRLGTSMDSRIMGGTSDVSMATSGLQSSSASLLDKKKAAHDSGYKRNLKSDTQADDARKGFDTVKKSRKFSSRDDSNDDGSADAEIRNQKRKRLRLLCHGCLCFRAGTTCKDRKCRRAVQLWEHVRKCNRGDTCDTPHCRSSQEVLRHFRHCRAHPEEGIHCKICSPFVRAAALENSEGGGAYNLEGSRGSARL